MSVKRISILVVSGIAFAGGVIFASSMDWTDRVFAQGTPAQTAPPQRPRTDEVRTIADASNAFVAISEYITPAVVSIQAQRTARPRGSRRGLPPGFEDLFKNEQPEQQAPTQESTGSGFIVSRDGYILTNNHVVEGADRVRVAMQDRRVFDARIIGRDPSTDVAVLKIEGRNFTAIPLGDDEAVKIGEWVLAIGNPLGLDFTVTAGIVSAKGRGLAGVNSTEYAITDFIQTDAAINPGNSGGPLVNARGEVIGMNTAIASQTGFFSGYGFAIPISLAKIVMDDLIAHGEVRRAVLGVSVNEVTPEDAEVAGLRTISGVKIIGFTGGEDSPARRAGVEQGDVVTKIDGRPVDRVSALQRMVRAKKPGDNVELELYRYGTRKVIRVTLMAQPREGPVVASSGAAKSNDPDLAPAATSRLGVTVAPLSAEVVRASRIPEQYRGVRVVGIDNGGPAEERIFPNDVIAEVLFPAPRARISDVDDLQTAIGRVRAGEIISLLVYRPTSPTTGATVVVNIRTK
jgi:serine protease Do